MPEIEIKDGASTSSVETTHKKVDPVVVNKVSVTNFLANIKI